MQFQLRDAKSLFTCDDEYVENLQKNGFTVTKEEFRYDEDDDYPDITVKIEIGTLEELMKVIDIVGNRLVVNKKEIIIYNDYIE